MIWEVGSGIHWLRASVAIPGTAHRERPILKHLLAIKETQNDRLQVSLYFRQKDGVGGREGKKLGTTDIKPQDLPFHC